MKRKYILQLLQSSNEEAKEWAKNSPVPFFHIMKSRILFLLVFNAFSVGCLDLIQSSPKPDT